MFDAKKTKDELIQWIKDYFRENGGGCKAVVGISGGKDSSTVAALCAEALGCGNVIGVIMPNGEQHDIDYSYELCAFLKIQYFTVNIGGTVKSVYDAFPDGLEKNSVVTNNTPARIRMTVLYAVSGAVNGRVANTCNLSEDWVGYATKYGDAAGDFSPLSHLTVTEVKAVAKELGLPDKFIEKIPEDGLCGKTDEDNLGFTYAVLDRYIREGVCDDAQIKAKIDKMQRLSAHKLSPMPSYKPASV